MARHVAATSNLHERFNGVLYVILALLFIWNVWQLHQINERHNQFMRSFAAETPLMNRFASGSSSANMCRQLLPVHLWNRNPEDVPIPSRWRRRVV